MPQGDTRSQTETFIDADVLVAGGGTAGSAAAVAAARRGYRVLLVEESNCLGGISTAGGVNEWFASQEGIGDIFASLRDALRRGGLTMNGRLFNGEYLKYAWQHLAERAGVRLLLNASVIGAVREGNSIISAEIAACSRRITVRARIFIDATGEGDLGFLAGCECMKGSPQTGRVLHMTLTACMARSHAPVTPYLPDGLEPIACDADCPGLRVHMPLEDGRCYCNMTKVMGLDPTDPFELTAAECEARRQLMRMVHYLQRTRLPDHILVSSGSRIGIREGRRMVGDCILAESDILGAAPFDCADGVCVGTSQIDFHSLTASGAGGRREEVRPYAIPYRCLVAKGVENLLVAGKCISVDQVVHSSCRMTPTCCAMGQAAGTAAALALECGTSQVRRIDIQTLRRQLAADGIELDPRRHTPFAPDADIRKANNNGSSPFVAPDPDGKR